MLLCSFMTHESGADTPCAPIIAEQELPPQDGIYAGLGQPGIDTLSMLGEFVGHLCAHPERYNPRAEGMTELFAYHGLLEILSDKLPESLYREVAENIAALQHPNHYARRPHDCSRWEERELEGYEIAIIQTANVRYICHELDDAPPEATSAAWFRADEARLLATPRFDCGRLVIKHANLFEGVRADRKLANYLVDQGGALTVLNYASYFNEPVLNRSIAEAVVASDYGFEVLRRVSADPNLIPDLQCDQALAELLIAEGQADVVQTYRHLFVDFAFNADLRMLLYIRGGPRA